MKEYKPFKSGKVREVYDAGDSIIMVATDRISAFDHILKNKITQKGQVLTQMSKFWFDLTADIVPNHMISVDNKDMPEFFQQEQFPLLIIFFQGFLHFLYGFRDFHGFPDVAVHFFCGQGQCERFLFRFLSI